MRDYEKHVLDVEAHVVPLLWFYRIVPHRSCERLEDQPEVITSIRTSRWSGSTGERMMAS
jgi:hypothetical protein